MMFSNNFVVSIHDSGNNVLRENRGKEVFLPFNSEYKIRLRNNHSRKAVAEVSIDGTSVLGPNRIIVEANSFVDLERFCIDGDLKNGSRFKFVKAGPNNPHPDVQDPTSPDNGGVRVKFWLEIPDKIGYFRKDANMGGEYAHGYPENSPYQTRREVNINIDGDCDININAGGCSGYSGISGYSGFSGTGNIGIGTSNPNITFMGWNQVASCSTQTADAPDYVTGRCDRTQFSSPTFYSPLYTASNWQEIEGSLNYPLTINEDETGATVEGRQSNQTFQYDDFGELEDHYTEIVLTIKPFKKPLTVKTTKHKYCDDCGTKNKYSARFCTNCGSNFDKMARRD